MSLPPAFLDELKSRLKLSEIVGRKVKLTRRGEEFVGLCPVHNEKTPSFTVSDQKGFLHCFGCGLHEDVIGWTQKIDNLEWWEAVAKLVDLAGMKMPERSPQDRAERERQATLEEVLAGAAGWFHRRIKEGAGSPGWEYLVGRGIAPEMIERHQLGWAPDERDALRRAFNSGDSLLIEVGLIRQPQEGDGSPYDFFRGRVIFPIQNRRGQVIGFSGRTLSDGPKYVNSPDSPLFHKGSVLYGWPGAEDRRDDMVVIVEGYVDVIQTQHAGFQTLAPMGTALTENQLRELWKMSPEPILCFDGDAAGDMAAHRVLRRALPLLRADRRLLFARLPLGDDPDTLVRRRGADAFARVIEDAKHLSEKLWDIEISLQPYDTPERRADLRDRIEKDIGLITDETVQAEYKRFMFTKFADAVATPAPRLETDMAVGRLHALFRVLLLQPELVADFADELRTLDLAAAPDLAQLRDALLEGGDAPAPGLRVLPAPEGFLGALRIGVLADCRRIIQVG